MKNKNLLGGLLCMSFLSVANASVITLTAGYEGENRGAINSRQVVEGLNDSWKVQDGNYQVRSLGAGFPVAIEATRNYHIFNIPELAAGESVTDVTFSIPHPTGSYQSPDPTETFGLFDIDSANFSFLRSPALGQDNAPADFTLDDLEAAYIDIGEGISYGDFTSSSADNGATQSFSVPALHSVLTAFGQSGGGDFGIGSAIITNTHTELDPDGEVIIERVFRASANFAPESSLVITTVPVPAAVWLFVSGLIGLVGTAQRRKIKLS